MGDINVFTGPMKCGKTQKILDEAKRQEIAGKNVKIFKPSIDDRFSNEKVISRNGFNKNAINISNIEEIKKYDADVYVIDEFQFLKGDLNELYNLTKAGKKFFIAGLNLTSERKPFGAMGELMCMSDRVQMLTAVCENCKSEDILVGDEDLYMPVCRKCYEKLIKTEE